MPADTFAKLPVHVLINDPKKLFQKKVYVTIPQWFETFPNVSDLRSGPNRAKCGLVLNDPIDWFKLRLNQPTKFLVFSRLEKVRTEFPVFPVPWSPCKNKLTRSALVWTCLSSSQVHPWTKMFSISWRFSPWNLYQFKIMMTHLSSQTIRCDSTIFHHKLTPGRKTWQASRQRA